jgi:hypothetical protein
MAKGMPRGRQAAAGTRARHRSGTSSSETLLARAFSVTAGPERLLRSARLRDSRLRTSGRNRGDEEYESRGGSQDCPRNDAANSSRLHACRTEAATIGTMSEAENGSTQPREDRGEFEARR